MLRIVRIVLRLIAIARTLARHDALAFLDEMQLGTGGRWLVRRLPRRRTQGRSGQKLARALSDLGPTFIKLGQFLSTRADLLGEHIAADLAELQDRLKPYPAAQARAIIESELGRPIEALFAEFSDTPVSAASIAQVHFAVTAPEAKDSEAGDPAREVAVKVLRPGIARAFERDLDLFYWFARLVERTQPRLRRFAPVAAVRQFEGIVRLEMDLAMEGAAAAELAENFAGDESYSTPQIDWQRTSGRVLTMGRVAGIRIDDRAALLAAGFDLRAVLTKAATVFFNQVFRDGFFHGDQHPGNILVDAQGNIVAVDFGIMGRLDTATRAFLAEMLLALLDRDYVRLAEVHVEAGYLPAGQPLPAFAQALRSVCEPIFDRPLQDISFARLLARLLSLSEAFDMPVQPQLLLLQKNMMMAEGISRSLDPELNIWTLAEPLIIDWMRAHHGPEARLRRAAEEFSDTLQRLPHLVAKIEAAADTIVAGDLEVNHDFFNDRPGRDNRARWHMRALWLVVGLLALGWIMSAS